MSRSEWEAYQARERREARIKAVAGWITLFLAATIMVLIGWLAIVGFIAVFG